MQSASTIARARRARFRVALASAALALAPAARAGAQCIQPGTGQAWQIYQPPQSSLVLAADGSLMGEIGRAWRTSVPLSTLPRYVPEAFIAIEDQRFYRHDGVDVVGIAGALKDALGGHARGASTITQQLVGNLHPELVDRGDRSIERKLREQSAAREMEKHYSKQQILEAYLNLLDFGHGWCGVEAASRHYFGHPASQLTLTEAATLAALPRSAVIWDPVRHPDRARERRNLVLGLMADQGYITRAAAAAAQREPLVVVPDAGMPSYAPYFVAAARRAAERAGISVTQGGYRIVTTADPALQRDAKQALDSVTARIEERPGYSHPTLAKHAKGSTDYLQGMVVALDPFNGDVLALVGGRDFSQSPFDRALDALRQPGSAFKPIVYAQAIRDSIPPNEIIPDTALAIPMDRNTIYRPVNADGDYLGPLTMREALVRSRNPVAVQLGMRVGIDSVADLAKRLGIDTPIAPYPSSAIGATALHPIELVSAYAAFDNLGSAVEPRFLKRIEDTSGRVVWQSSGQAPRFAIDPRVAFIVRDMMRDVVERGTGQVVGRIVPERIPVAGKTGTTNDGTDVWFVGMTPEIVAGVWLGFDKPQPIVRGAAGGTLAGPIFGEMIAKYYEGREAGEWEPPAGLAAVDLDRDTGQPATIDTPAERRYTEYFIEGTEPGAVKLDPWSIFQYGPVGF